MTLVEIGKVSSPWKTPEQCPLQPCFAEGAEGILMIRGDYRDALSDLHGFERLWMICYADRARRDTGKVLPYQDLHPRGVFATRAPSRPNPIVMSCVRLLSIEGTAVRVADVDVLDGTPLLDLKPYVPRYDCWNGAAAGWLDHPPVARSRGDGRFSQG
jgi:tRNA-Thr(GGU) m(6)t(6)A37 methyltransferase TsaA